MATNKKFNVRHGLSAGTGTSQKDIVSDTGLVYDVGTLSALKTTAKSDTVAAINELHDEIVDVASSTNEPMGVVDRTHSVISFNNTTKTFSIALASGRTEFVVWTAGTKRTYTTTQSVSIGASPATGLYYIFFNQAGVLSYKTTYFDWPVETPIAYVYWNASTAKAEFVADERHGIVLDWQTHEYLHRTRGAVIANGFSISNYTTTGDGSVDVDALFDLGNGTFFDEDLEVNITHSATPTAGTFTQVLTGGAEIPVFYINGSDGAWVRDAATKFACKQSATTLQYNLLSGTTWSTVPATNNRYVVSWIVATNDINAPIITILGQAEYTDIGGAEAVVFGDLALTNFPIFEFRPLWKVIFRTSTGYPNTPNAYIARVLDLRELSSAGSGGSIVSDHGLLTGLADDDHSQYLHVSNTRTGVTAEFNTTGKITTTNRIGIGTTTPQYDLHIVGTTDPSGMFFDAYGVVAPNIAGRRANGTTIAPTVVNEGDNLLAVTGSGYTGTEFSIARAIMFMKASETWTSTAQGAHIDFITTAPGTTSRSTKLRLDGYGSLLINSLVPTGTASQLLQVTGGGYFSSRVGIGITNPAETLDVVGNIKLTGELRGPASFVIDPAAVGDNTGTVIIRGDLQVDGTTTTINSTTLSIDDKNITIADGVSTLANLDTAGIDFGSTAVRLRYNYNSGTNSGLSIEGTRVGIGSTVPTTTLEVSGGDAQGIRINATAGYPVLWLSQASNNTWSISSNYNSDSAFVIRESGIADRLNIKQGGNVGIGTTNPRGRLDVTMVGGSYNSDNLVIGGGNLTYPTSQYSGWGGIVVKGTTSDARMFFQDGNGRINSYWNAYTDTGGYKYIVSNEPAIRNVMSVVGTTGGQWGLYGAPAGTAGGALTWTQTAYIESGASGGTATAWISPRGTSSDFFINSSGNVMLGAAVATGTASQPLQVTGGAYFSGNIGVGVTNPLAQLHVYGPNFPLARIERNTALTTGMRSTFSAIHTTSADMVDGFGADVSFGIRDSAGVDNEIANFGAIRDGADNSGALVFATTRNGTEQGAIKMILKSTGNVGIGTTNPASKLHVSGGDLFVNSLDGNNVDIKLSVGTDSNSSIIRSTRSSDFQSSLSFHVSDDGFKEAARLNYDGLTVRGLSDGTTAGIAGNIVFSDQSELPLAQIASYKTGVGDNTDLVFGTYDENSFWISEKLRIVAGGNVGIGTENPGAKLTVWGPVTIGTNNPIDLGTAQAPFKLVNDNSALGGGGAIINELYSTATSSIPQPGYIARFARGTEASPLAVAAGDRLAFLVGGGYGTTQFHHTAAIDIISEEAYTDSARGSYIRFATTSVGQTARVEKLRITGAGNVGIGTTNPTSKLHVLGSGVFEAPGGFSAPNSDNPANVPLIAKLSDPAGNTFFGAINSYGYPCFAINTELHTNSSTGRGVIRFYDKTGGTWSSSINLNSGRVGIGTTNPGSALAVNGLITENPGDGTYWNVVTQKDIGLNANQVPLNQFLGQLAFIDQYSPSGLRRDGGGADDITVDSLGRILINRTTPFVGARLEIEENSINAHIGLVSQSDTIRPTIIFNRYKASAAAVVNTDVLGALDFRGYDGTNNRIAAQIIATADGAPSAGTVPGRLSFTTTAAGGANITRLIIDSNGRFGFGSGTAVGYSMLNQQAITGAIASYGLVMQNTIASDVTSETNIFTTAAQTAAASFTLGTIRHYHALGVTIGLGSAVTNQFGYFAESNMTSATNNYGFYGNLPSGTGRWNFYANGTAPNFFNGNVGIGTTAPSNKLTVYDGNLLVNTTEGGSITLLSRTASAAAYPQFRAEHFSNGFGGFPVVELLSHNGTASAPTSVTSGQILGGFNTWGYNGTTLSGATRIEGVAEATFSTSVSAGLVFKTTAAGVSAEKVRITATGNVGIGTTNPGALLQISGSDSIDANYLRVGSKISKYMRRIVVPAKSTAAGIADTKTLYLGRFYNGISKLHVYVDGGYAEQGSTFIFHRDWGVASVPSVKRREGSTHTQIAFHYENVDNDSYRVYINYTYSTGNALNDTNGFRAEISSNSSIGVFFVESPAPTIPTLNSANLMRTDFSIDNLGRVGIGVSNPTWELQLQKAQNSATVIQVRNPDDGVSAAAVLQLNNGASGGKYTNLGVNAAGNYFQNNGAGGITTLYQDYDNQIFRSNGAVTLLSLTTASMTINAIPLFVSSTARADARVEVGASRVALAGAAWAATGSATVTITYNSHGFSDGNRVDLVFTASSGSNATSGNYVVSGATANTFTITNPASITGSGTCTIGSSGNAYIDLTGDSTYNDYGLRMLRGNTGPNADSIITNRGNGLLTIQTEGTGALSFNTNATARVTISSTGNVGVGTATPISPLSIAAVSDIAQFAGYDSANTFIYGLGRENNGLTLDAYSGITFRTGSTTGSRTGSVKAVITSAGLVGIGTTNPTWVTDIYRDVDSAANNLRLANASVGNAAYAILNVSCGGSNTYLFANSPNRSTDGGVNTATLRNDSGDLRLQASGSVGLHVKATTGNVGIGTTNPVDKLHVEGVISSRSGPNNVTLNHDGTNAALYSSGQLLLYASGTGNLILHTAGVQRFHINTIGNIGIGTNTPTSRLAVNGLITENSGDGTYWNVVTQRDVGLNANQVPLNQYLGQLAFLDQYSPAGLRRDGGGSDDLIVDANGRIGIGITNPGGQVGINTAPAWSSFNYGANLILGGSRNNGFGILDSTNSNPWWIGNASGSLLFSTMPALGDTSTAANGRFTIASTGNVGIGTLSPSHKLHIGPQNGSHLFLASVNNAFGWVIDTQDFTAGSVPLRIYKRTAGVDTESVTILNQSGNVGIGITLPTYKLQVNGSFAATTKSFVIDHPTKPDHKLRYGSLEGPENGVYIRGRLRGTDTIELPEYWTELVDEDSITVNLTPIGSDPGVYSIIKIANNTVTVASTSGTIDCFFMVLAERKDVEKLVVEYESES